jgi:hypothetical protein
VGQAQAALRVGKDPHHRGAELNFLVQALEQVGALEMLVMLAWESIKAQRFFEVPFDLGGAPRIFARPPRQPSRQVAARFDPVAAGVEPAQLLQAIVIDFARDLVQGVAQKVDIAALPDGFG